MTSFDSRNEVRGQKSEVRSYFPLPRWWLWIVLWCVPGVVVGAAERAPSSAMTTTQLVIKLATNETIPVQSRFSTSPPTITLSFPARRVLATLPERSVIQQGVVQEVRAVYAAAVSQPVASRWLRSLSIQLRGRYRYQVRSDPGRIVIEIEHPSTMASETIEVGLLGSLVGSGALAPRVTERFMAMQHALSHAQAPSIRSQRPRLVVDDPGMPTNSPGVPEPIASLETLRLESSESPQTPAPEPHVPWTTWWWVLMGVGAMGVLGAGWWSARAGRWSWNRWRFPPPRRSPSAGIQLIDQLVWQAFERQGHELLHTVELGQALGLMRVMIREGKKTALWCVGIGALFETSTVERFVQSMRSANVDQGFLIAPGSFTIPAQRYASAHGVSLLGREQLIELIGTGAMVASYTKQLEHVTHQLTEAKETIEQYAKQLELLRRQRNEASWYLGEERVQSSQLEARLSDLTQHVQHWKTQAEQMTAAAETAKKQWEESQWYLGEARTALNHLQDEMRSLRQSFEDLAVQHHQTVVALQEARGQRDEAKGLLEEARQVLQQQLHHAEEQVRQAQAQLDAMQEFVKERDTQLEAERTRRIALEDELKSLRSSSERRQYPRINPAAFTAELRDYGDTPLYRGHVRDLSLKGFGVDTPIPLDFPATLPVRARLTWPGCRRPLESHARLVWKRQDAITQRYQQGFELEGISERASGAMLRAFPALQTRARSTKRTTRRKSEKRITTASSS